MATRTDPVEAATDALSQAQRARDEAAAAMETFKTRILAGDENVSPNDYGDAAHAVEHAELKVQAAALALQAAHEAARLQRLHDLKAEIIEQIGTPDDALADWNALVEVCGRIITRTQARRRMIGEATGRMRHERVPRHTNGTPADEHAGMGWAEARMGSGDTINLDGRTIQDLEPGMIIASAAYAEARAQGISFLRLYDNDALKTDPERWFRTRY